MTEEDDAICREAGWASFADVVLATFEAQRTRTAAGELDTTCQAFTKRFGPIIYSRFGKNIACGVALTDTRAATERKLAALSRSAAAGGRPAWHERIRVPRWERGWWRHERRLWLTEQRKPVRLHMVLPSPAAVDVLTSLSRCGTQAIYARRFLQDEELRQCLALLYWPADALVALADADAAAAAAVRVHGPAEPAMPAATRNTSAGDPNTNMRTDVVNKQLDSADQYYQHFTQRTIRMAYFRGIGYGMVAVVAIFLASYLFRGFFKAPIGLLWSIMAGALGALTSVLSSATFGRIVLDRTQGGIWNTFLGAFRPIIGALFGAAFFVLINAGFLPVKIPSGNAVALYASIAFLAGFSHRWAQDTLKSAENKIHAPPSPAGSGAEQDTSVRPSQQKP